MLVRGILINRVMNPGKAVFCRGPAGSTVAGIFRGRTFVVGRGFCAVLRSPAETSYRSVRNVLEWDSVVWVEAHGPEILGIKRLGHDSKWRGVASRLVPRLGSLALTCHATFPSHLIIRSPVLFRERVGSSD
jgi:hypothetical protein